MSRASSGGLWRCDVPEEDDRFSGVLDVLTREDPAGLIAGGAPRNEYTMEATLVCELLRDGPGEVELAKAIAGLFRRRMGIRIEGSERLARLLIMREKTE